MVGYIRELQERHGKKCLWVTANQLWRQSSWPERQRAAVRTSLPLRRRRSGPASTRLSELDASGYVFWGGREGYETLLNTDMGLELDNLCALPGNGARLWPRSRLHRRLLH